MNETMKSKLTRILQNKHIYKLEINIKCKTKDGMIFTMCSHEHDRADVTDVEKECNISFAEHVDTCSTQELLHINGVVEDGDGFWICLEEMCTIRHGEIVRIWAELGDLYYDDASGLPCK